MELNRKTIQINPELFKMNGGGNTTRKKKSDSKIRIKTKINEKPKKLSTIKRNILKMIRNQQDERRKQQNQTDNNIDTTYSVKTPSSSSSQIVQEFENKFNDSLEFLSNLTKEVDNKKQSYTIKRYPSLPEPTYGCLKNGRLPTYRTWVNQTRKNNPNPQQQKQSLPPQIIYPSQLQYQQPSQIIINNPNKTQVSIPVVPIQEIPKSNTDGLIKQFSKIQQFERKNTTTPISKKWKYPKQKKTIRRTYYVGRSKVHPRISVLVSNKTIRARTTLKQQELKQVPITDVRKYLLKHGFIKVGTSSPNAVLREMYESAQLICGEIKNHNSENLLYNYFNASPSEL